MQQFKTESKRILNLVINSIYTNKDVFLRELISNASDALDKVVLREAEAGAGAVSGASANARSGAGADASATQGAGLGAAPLAAKREIHLAFDKDARTLTVSDCGIGMSKEQLEAELGTIARSSSFDIKSSEDAAGDANVDIIGQFGVGFYSSFMVADQVTVVSRAYGASEAFQWESDGVEGFTISPSQRESYGTDVILRLRADDANFEYSKYLSHPALEELVVRYSNYIRYPITLDVTGRREVASSEGKYAKDVAFEDYQETVTLNSMVPIWAKPSNEVTLEEYDEFYKKEFDDPKTPLKVISMHARGGHNCDVLLYVPAEPPADLYSSEFKKGLELYSSGVLIQERCETLIPEYFGFVRGVVDSPDLELNLSREAIQDDVFLKAVARQIEKRLLMEMEAMRDNEREAYVELYANYGRMFKFALYATFGALNEKLEDLLLFFTAKRDEPVTLKEYLEAMPDSQPCVLFASGDESDRLEASPSVVAATSLGYDVLLCSESIDELAMMTLRSYRGKPIKNVTASDVNLGSPEDVSLVNEANETYQALFGAMADILPADVSEVRATSFLATVPASIAAAGPISLGMEKYFASMPEEMGGKPTVSHVLEMNTKHPVFKALCKAFDENDLQKVKRYAIVLHGQALLAEGLPLPDFSLYSQAVYELMQD